MQKFLVCVLGLSFLAGTCGLVAAQDKGEKKKKGQNPEALFGRLDKNGDKKLSLEEYTARGVQQAKGDEEKAAKAKERAKAAFARADKDQDGSLSLEEFTASMNAEAGKKKKKDKD